MSQTTQGQSRPNTNCIICLQLADQALVTSCCVDIICNQCFTSLPTKKCPKCRQQNFQAKPQLYLRRFIQEISPQIQFFVKPMTGGMITIKLRQLDTTDMVFQRVFQRTLVPIENMQLSFDGKNLKPIKKSLRSSNIKSLSTIQQLGRLKGGQIS